MNDQSSCSHSVFDLHLTATNAKLDAVVAGQLYLCDLAGGTLAGLWAQGLELLGLELLGMELLGMELLGLARAAGSRAAGASSATSDHR